jgi:hypothetical protein
LSADVLATKETAGSDQSTTRRRILKRAAIGGAAAYAVPLALGTSAAFAKASKVCAANSGASTTGLGACTACPAANNPCGTSCFCFVTVKGCCFCAANTDCNTPCTSNKQCAAGSQCVYTCCDGVGAPGLRCLPACGTVAASAPRSGRRAASI